jgi:16S rRNA (cytidine1402-2'-O)-methyltransferase
VSTKGTVYMIPTIIADDTQYEVIAPSVIERLKSIRHFLVEDVRSSRRYLSSLKIYERIEALEFHVLNKDTTSAEIEKLFSPVMAGLPLGILSESGCPGVADPGALAAAYAHKIGVRIVPLVGPSSILLAVMASGLNGQQFAFHGYLPVDKSALTVALKNLEQESRTKRQTQIFIETPYRNNAMFSTILKTLNTETILCVALDLTGKEESVQSRRIAEWKRSMVEWPKLPAVFLFLAH